MSKVIKELVDELERQVVFQAHNYLDERKEKIDEIKQEIINKAKGEDINNE